MGIVVVVDDECHSSIAVDIDVVVLLLLPWLSQMASVVSGHTPLLLSMML